MTYEKELREQTEYEKTILALPPEERARNFSRRYYRFFHHARTGKQPTERDMQKAGEELVEWFTEHPKRLIPDPQAMFHLATIGKPTVIGNSLYGFYENALDRDYKEVKWRK